VGALTPLNVAAQVAQDDDGMPGDLTLAQVRYEIADSSAHVIASLTTDVAANGASMGQIAGLNAGTYQLTVKVVGGYFTSQTSGPITIVVQSPTAVTLADFSADQGEQDTLPGVAHVALVAAAAVAGCVWLARKRRQASTA
jgi:hypothetical protein